MSTIAYGCPVKRLEFFEPELYVVLGVGPNVSTPAEELFGQKRDLLAKLLSSVAQAPVDPAREARAIVCLRRAVDASIRVRCPGEILHYLSRHNDIIPALSTVTRRARECAASGDELALELYRDPELPDEYLTLKVRRREYDESILVLAEALQQEAEEAMLHASGWLLITTDFRAPQGI